MNYGEIERQTFRTFLAFSSILFAAVIVFFNVTSNSYRVSSIVYNVVTKIDKSSIDDLKGTSIWLVEDSYFEKFYEDNPSVESITIKKELPSTLIVDITISERLALIQDNRQSPPKTFVLYKNLYTNEEVSDKDLLYLKINNGPVKEGFYEELITFVLTLNKYSLNISNVELSYDGNVMIAEHFNTQFYIGSPSDLARKASVVGYYLSESPCEGEVRLVYTEDGSEIRAVTNCK
tara:strand:- start:237 stop:938 length:702 start_codon:yes stop_codon:yes gene_type:complete